MNLGVYIQVPFCQTKCTYCNFHTGVVAREKYAPYAAAVRREIAKLGAFGEISALRDAAVDTVYFGGGTPSLLEPSALAGILCALRQNFAFADSAARPSGSTSTATAAAHAEITLEADPETITPEKAQAWIAAGFNRISLGVQSFNDHELQAAGRMHRRADVFAASQILREAGFCNVSMDLIAGLAQQTRESWEESVERILEIRPEHISIYLLEIDEGSRLGKESLAGGSRYSAESIPSDDAMAEAYESACACLAEAGYEHYEISNWGLPGFRSRHNLKYWRREPYIGLGAGAHSFDGERVGQTCTIQRSTSLASKAASRRANRSNRSRRNKRSTKNYFWACASSQALISPASKKSTASACNRASRLCANRACWKWMARCCASRQRI